MNLSIVVSSKIYKFTPLPNVKFKSFPSVTRTALIVASRRYGGHLTGCYASEGLMYL